MDKKKAIAPNTKQRPPRWPHKKPEYPIPGFLVLVDPAITLSAK
jgi:hypothetical protein